MARIFPAVFILPILLAVPAAGQADYTLYGIGCPGSGAGPNTCVSLNGSGGALVIRTLPNEYGFPVQAPSAMVVLGFQLYTQGAGGLAAMTKTALYLEDSATPGKPAFTPVATGQMPVGPTADFFTTLLDTPVPIQKDQWFWIAQVENTAVVPCDLSAGASPAGLIYWRRANYSGNAWTSTGTLKYPSWRIICPGSGTGPARPYLHADSTPQLGKLINVHLNHAFGPSAAILFFGASRTTWSGLPLPLGLSPAGAPGCSIHAAGTLLISTATTASGSALFPLAVPMNPVLLGAEFFQQWAVLDPKANALQLVFSNAGAGRVGP